MTVSRHCIEAARLAIANRGNGDAFLRSVDTKLSLELDRNKTATLVTIEASESGAVKFVGWIIANSPTIVANEWSRAFNGVSPERQSAYQPTASDLANARQSDAELDAIEANRIEAERWARSMFLEVPRNPQIKSRLLDNWRTKPGQSDWQRWSNRVEKYTGPMDRPAAELKAAGEVWPADEPPKQASLFD